MARLFLGGFVGTSVMTFMMYFVRPKLVGAPKDIAAEPAGQVGAPWGVGMAMHYVLGAVVIPLLLAFVLSKVLPGPSVVKGLLTGVGFWLLAMTVMMPMMGKGFFLSASGEGPKAVMAAFMAHAVYGALVGAIGGPAISRTMSTQTASNEPTA